MKSTFFLVTMILSIHTLALPIHSHVFKATATVPACYMTSEQAYLVAERTVEEEMTKKCLEFNASPKVTLKNVKQSTTSCGSTEITTKYRCLNDGLTNIVVEQYLYVGSMAENLKALDQKLERKVKGLCPSFRAKVLSTELEMSSTIQVGEEVDFSLGPLSETLLNYPKARLKASTRCIK